MEHKLIFVALFLFASADVQCRNGVPYEYEERPAVLTRSALKIGSNSRLDSLNKNRNDKKFGKWMNQGYDLLGTDSELRKFQKAINVVDREVGLRRPRLDACPQPLRHGNVLHNMRRASPQFSHNIDLNKKIQELVQMSILHKYKQAMDSFLSGNVNNASGDRTKLENKSSLNDYMSESNNASLGSDENEDGELDEY